MLTNKSFIRLGGRLAAGLALAGGTFLVQVGFTAARPAAAYSGSGSGSGSQDSWSGGGQQTHDGGGQQGRDGYGGGGQPSHDAYGGGGQQSRDGYGGNHQAGPAAGPAPTAYHHANAAPASAPPPNTAPQNTAPHEFVPHETTPHETTPHETTPHETAAHEHDPHTDPAVNVASALGTTGPASVLTAASHPHHVQLAAADAITQPLPLAALVGAPVLVASGLVFARRRRASIRR